MQTVSDCQVGVQHSGHEGQDGTGVGSESGVCENTTGDMALGPGAQATRGDEHVRHCRPDMRAGC